MKTTDDTMDRNQNIAGHFHRINIKPLISGATLGGVLRLCSLVSKYPDCFKAPWSERVGQIENSYKIEIKPM